MKNITSLIESWINESLRLYKMEYIHKNDGWHDFIDVEERLFKIYVLDNLSGNLQIDSMKEAFPYLIVKYKNDIYEERSFEKRKNGNIIIASKNYFIKKGETFHVCYIDSYGQMNQDIPCIAINFSKNECVYESIDNVEIFLNC
jgi:hypothetical protein